MNSCKLLGFKPEPKETELGKASDLSRHTIDQVITSNKKANLASTTQSHVHLSNQQQKTKVKEISTPKDCSNSKSNKKQTELRSIQGSSRVHGTSNNKARNNNYVDA